jgi:hypothetical protein
VPRRSLNSILIGDPRLMYMSIYSVRHHQHIDDRHEDALPLNAIELHICRYKAALDETKVSY